MNKNYDDIINLPHFESKKHKRMSLEARSAQFAPFSALTGYEDIVKETARLTDKKIEIEAKVRYRSKPAKAILYPLETGKAKIIFEEAQRAVTPGQSLVFYDNDIVLGGGKIL